MISLGIDPSLTGTGLVVLEDGEVVLAEVLSTEVGDDGVGPSDRAERARDIAVETRELTEEHYERPGRIPPVAIEYGGWRQKDDAFIAGMLYKSLHTMLNHHSITEVSPTTLKKYLTGDGSASKRDLVLPVYKRFGVEFDDDNLLDAFGLAHLRWAVADFRAACKTVKHGNEFTQTGYIKPQLEVLQNYLPVDDIADPDYTYDRGSGEYKEGGKKWKEARADALLELQEELIDDGHD